MSKFHDIPVSFHQGCPVCGRLLDIRVTLLGRRVYCQHCGGAFIAADPATAPAAGRQARDRRVAELIERADLALEKAASQPPGDEAWQTSD